MFSIGDLVVHPMHGAGVIDDIVQEKVAGVMKEYYVFKMPVGGLVLKIPTKTFHAAPPYISSPLRRKPSPST